MNSIKQEQDDNRVYDVDENQREQRYHNMSEQVEEPSRITRKDIDMLEYEHELLTQKLDNKRLAFKAVTLEEEKGVLEEEKKVLTLKNEKLAAEKTVIQNEKHTLQDEKKSLLNENQTLLHKCQDLQNEKKKLEKEKESMNVKYERLQGEKHTLQDKKKSLLDENQTLLHKCQHLQNEKKKLEKEKESMNVKYKLLQGENLWIKDEMEKLNDVVITEQKRNTLSSSPGEVDLSESFSSHTKQLEEKIEKILKENMDQLHEASSKKSAENMKQIQNMFAEKLKDTEQKLCADQEKHAKDEEARVSALIETFGNNNSRHERLNDEEASVESDKELDKEVCKIDDANCKNDDIESEDDESAENATPVCNEDTISVEVSDEVSFPIHDKKIDHIIFCNVRGVEILITASGRVLKVTRVKDGTLLKRFSYNRCVTSILLVTMKGSTVLVCGCSDNTMTFVSLRNYEEITSLTRKSPILRMSLRKNGERYLLACALKNGRLELFDVKETRFLTALSIANPNPNFNVFEMFRSGEHHKLYLAVGADENRVDICSLDRNRAQVIASLPIKCQTINTFCTFLNDGEICMAAGATHKSGLSSIILYKFSDSDVHFDGFIRSEFLKNRIDHLKPILRKDCSPMLLSHGAYSDSIYLWNVTTRKLIRTVNTTHEIATFDMRSHQKLVSGSSNGTAMLWKINAKEESRVQELKPTTFEFDKSSNDKVLIESNFDIHDDKINHMIITSIDNCDVLITASMKIIKTTSIEHEKLLWTSSGCGGDISCMYQIISTSGSSILAHASCDNTLVFTCMKTYKEIAVFQCVSPIYRMAVDKTKHGVHIFLSAMKNGQIDIWEINEERQCKICTLDGNRESPVGLDTFRNSDDKKLHLAIGTSSDSIINIWCLEKGENKVVSTIDVNSKRIYSLCTFSQDEKTFIAAGVHELKIKIFSTKDLNLVYTLHSSYLNATRFLSTIMFNGSLSLMSCGPPNTSAYFWQVSNKKLVHTMDTGQEIFSSSSYETEKYSIIATGSGKGKVFIQKVNKIGSRDRKRTNDSTSPKQSKRARKS